MNALLEQDKAATKCRIAAVIVAAGRGERAGQNASGPKQYRPIGDKPVIRHTIEAFALHPRVDVVVTAIHPQDADLFAAAADGIPGDLRQVDGGASRQESTRLALASLAGLSPEIVVIHDAVRPFVDGALIDRVVDAVTRDAGALPAVAVSDTLKRCGDADMRVRETVPRDGLYAAQTPQAFPFRAILAAHEKAREAGLVAFTDDAAIAEWAGIAVTLVKGSPDNVKLTWASDLALADERLKGVAARMPDVRTGNGYDVHAFGAGDHVMLCGVRIDHDRTLTGHSDADVGLHALTDALLATCGAGDIGTHFPPTDPQWKGAASRLFVEHAVGLVRERGGRIANADITLICEAPKIGPHRTVMVEALESMLGIAPERISIKATTNERLGFVGRQEGIAALATVSVVYPGSLPE
ncbi:bifunctional 2-C-methyl-D-erythritol 4-phosphate cytidylyltransferase/2-C-methyl-D-erythritol 2,4-cyclodiphosphate synthase [Chelativorans sp. M5D2P16]|uniref:bifunctional 2-C-methyl-D-erythritol 4-phosphate cytidylyltransferase/2-C-methyl-D-erythritol 2,4-cyclodiphosphate synthase n=1 Tax=Chelativorans sp. M5D2P16 TaxID=3095678 RepID=UPI002ACA9598|nr:bifunctional 2-C-methyl-D-erythritol 4-phosphate cytidylyltransferase/2-C-methyl-D-erythritol 2,4-cyclodiphosphate synthase [Chelativorans sp. M5D2P16]MDZ5697731.1 bifunctional 2-C-methyl-D-erythritol 4-phosphate cytidylyltransferase/2-C-methyl-D-erythritol 2,4-cyclodiphosphate synthase [Chelativorans sp. M5D2P16]